MKILLARCRGLPAGDPRSWRRKIAAGLEGPALAAAKTSLFNARIDIGVTATFLILVTIIVLGTAYECWVLLSGRKPIMLRESPRVLLPEAGGGGVAGDRRDHRSA